MKKLLLLLLCVCIPLNAMSAEALKATVEHKQTKKPRTFKKVFKTGIVKEIEPIIVLQTMYTGKITDGSSARYSRFTSPVGVLGFKGKLRENTEFNLSVNFPRNIYHKNYMSEILMEYYLTHKIAPGTTLLVGQARIPIGSEGYLPPTLTLFPVRSQIARTFGKTRDVGTQLLGDYKYVDTVVAVTDGSRYLQAGGTGGADFAGWVNFKPLAGKPQYGKMILGTGIDTGREQFSYNVLGGYAKYQKGKFCVDYEYSKADGYNGAATAKKKASGFYTTLTYDLTPKIQLLTRYDRFDPNREVANNRTSEYSVGANYYQKGQKMKYMLDYVFVTNDNAPKQQRIMVMTQYIL